MISYLFIYFRRILAFVYFLGYFLIIFVKANVSIGAAILFQSIECMEPNIISMDVSDLEKWEIILLSQCITLTPGTTTIEITKDLKIIYIHAFDAKDPKKVIKSIEKSLKNPILRFTR